MNERGPDWEALRRAYAPAQRAPEGQDVASGVPALPAPPSAPPGALGGPVPGPDDPDLVRDLAEERAAIMLEAGDVPEAEVRAYLLRTYGFSPVAASGKK